MPTAPTAITTLPTAPSTNNPATFDALADAFIAALPEFVSDANALATNAYDNAVAAASSASTATTKASEASTSATAAAASQTSAASSATTATGAASTATTQASTATSAATTATTKASEASASAAAAAASAASISGGPVTSVNGRTGVVTGLQEAQSVTGLVKSSGVTRSAAVAGTDYQSPIGTISGLAKGNGANALIAATAGTDYVAPGTATSFTKPQRPSLSSETTPSSNTVTWDLTTDQIFRINLNASITTFSLTGTLSSLAGGQYQVVVRFNGGSAITWPASVKWPAGTAPTLTGTSGKVDIFNFVVSSTDGTNYYLLNTGKTQNLG